MSPLNEEQRKAKDSKPVDDTPFGSFGSQERMYPHRDTPDLLLFADAEPDQQMYLYTLQDAQSRLGNHGCGKLPTADENALRILSVTMALKSITQHRENESLCNRYGYSTMREAAASPRKLIVHVHVTDKLLAELGQVVADAAEHDLLPFIRTPDNAAYSELAKQLRRFDVTFQAVAVTDETLQRLRVWAAETMPRAAHNGPVVSPTRQITIAPQSAAESAA